MEDIKDVYISLSNKKRRYSAKIFSPQSLVNCNLCSGKKNFLEDS